MPVAQLPIILVCWSIEALLYHIRCLFFFFLHEVSVCTFHFAQYQGIGNTCLIQSFHQSYVKNGDAALMSTLHLEPRSFTLPIPTVDSVVAFPARMYVARPPLDCEAHSGSDND